MRSLEWLREANDERLQMAERRRVGPAFSPVIRDDPLFFCGKGAASNRINHASDLDAHRRRRDGRVRHESDEVAALKIAAA
ncbi:hypothetical protein [Burkholderia pyrrocinia]|uniref:hypothetical protein n=1 Tax=Burkholderia pyrrocinia TaxID=60550 RepID=UPI002AB1333D|nr:hypothetical protein [Burkholderia pyrrocinia]